MLHRIYTYDKQYLCLWNTQDMCIYVTAHRQRGMWMSCSVHMEGPQLAGGDLQSPPPGSQQAEEHGSCSRVPGLAPKSALWYQKTIDWLGKAAVKNCQGAEASDLAFWEEEEQNTCNGARRDRERSPTEVQMQPEGYQREAKNRNNSTVSHSKPEVERRAFV